VGIGGHREDGCRGKQCKHDARAMMVRPGKGWARYGEVCEDGVGYPYKRPYGVEALLLPILPPTGTEQGRLIS